MLVVLLLAQVLVYSFLGSAHHISIGTMAVVDIMLKGTLEKYAEVNDTDSPFGDSSGGLELEDYEDSKVQVMTSICLLTGLWQLLLGLVRIGSVALIFSDPLISAFSSSAAIIVTVSQVPTALGIQGLAKGAGPLALIRVSSSDEIAPFSPDPLNLPLLD